MDAWKRRACAPHFLAAPKLSANFSAHKVWRGLKITDFLVRNERCEQRRWESGLGSERVKRREGVGREPAGRGGASVMVSGGCSALIQTVTACRQQGELRQPLCIWLWASVRSEASPGALLYYTGKKINPTQVGPPHLSSNPGSFYICLLPDVGRYGNLTTVLFICNW